MILICIKGWMTLHLGCKAPLRAKVFFKLLCYPQVEHMSHKVKKMWFDLGESYKVFELKRICGPKGRRDFSKVTHLLNDRAKNGTWHDRQNIKMAPMTFAPGVISVIMLLNDTRHKDYPGGLNLIPWALCREFSPASGRSSRKKKHERDWA